MTMPEGSRRSAVDGLRQYLADNLVSVVGRMPRLREYLLALTRKLTDSPVDNGQAKRAAHLQTTTDGLQAQLSREAHPVISLRDAPDLADQQHIGDLIRWWMSHDPRGASQCMVEAVGLGGAYRLSEADRLKLARAFVAMLGVDLFELDQAPLGAGQAHNGVAASAGSPARQTMRPRPAAAP